MTETVKLSNGVSMPMEGFGVFQIPEQECEQVVRNAIESGYRLIDTASSYQNEEVVGRAVKTCGIPREELFITTKAYIQEMGYDNTMKAFEGSLKRLGLDYLDQVQIKVIKSQFFKRSLDCFLCAFVVCILYPELGCDEKFAAVYSAFLDCCADSFFIHIGGSSVDQTITAVYSIQNSLFALCRVRYLEYTKSFQRHFDSII